MFLCIYLCQSLYMVMSEAVAMGYRTWLGEWQTLRVQQRILPVPQQYTVMWTTEPPEVYITERNKCSTGERFPNTAEFFSSSNTRRLSYYSTSCSRHMLYHYCKKLYFCINNWQGSKMPSPTMHLSMTRTPLCDISLGLTVNLFCHTLRNFHLHWMKYRLGHGAPAISNNWRNGV